LCGVDDSGVKKPQAIIGFLGPKRLRGDDMRGQTASIEFSAIFEPCVCETRGTMRSIRRMKTKMGVRSSKNLLRPRAAIFSEFLANIT
jgi:hypothetical protein